MSSGNGNVSGIGNAAAVAADAAATASPNQPKSAALFQNQIASTSHRLAGVPNKSKRSTQTLSPACPRWSTSVIATGNSNSNIHDKMGPWEITHSMTCQGSRSSDDEGQ